MAKKNKKTGEETGKVDPEYLRALEERDPDSYLREVRGDGGFYSTLSSETAATGEWGFCEGCGEARAVVMPKADRLQERLRRAAKRAAFEKGVTARYLAENALDLGLHILRQLGTNPTQDTRLALRTIVGAVLILEGELSEVLGEEVDLVREATEGWEETAN